VAADGHLPISNDPTRRTAAQPLRMPWAEPSSRFTALFELLAIAWLQAASQKAVARLLRLSWDKIHGVMERAVTRGLERRQAEPLSQMGYRCETIPQRAQLSAASEVNDLVRARALLRGRRLQSDQPGRVLTCA